jgi:nucleotide-binding universal stress UspA family protein
MHILFPVDFSARCEASKPLVTSWARRFNAKLTLLHTIHIPISAYGGADGYPIIIDVPGLEESAIKRLDGFKMDIPGVERIVKVGDPALDIIQYTEKIGVDLIMMTTHGYGPFRGLLLGSVAAKVLHDAHCPVWTSAHIEDFSAPGRTEIRSILCAIELGAGAADLIRPAKELAEAYRATLRLVHAGPTTDEQIAAFQQHEETKLEVCIAPGAVSHVIRDAALKYDADLVVIGRGKLHETFGRLRSNDYAIIRDSPCPVLSV